MSNQLGADVAALEDLSRRMNETSSDVEAKLSELTAKLADTWWQGPDAERFRGDFDGNIRAKISAVSEALATAASEVQTHASQQTDASA